MASDPITGVATEEAPTTLDFLGKRSPIFSTGKPALPTGAAPAPSVAPSGPSGLGKPPTPKLAAPDVPSGLTEGFDFASLLGGGDPGAEGGGSPGVGQGTNVASGPAGLGFGFGFGPGSISIGPTGTISVGARGDSPDTSALAQTLNAALSFAGVPTSVNLPSLVAALTSSPVLGIAAQLAGAAGLPLTFTGLVHALASLSPTSVTSLQAALADPNPESQISTAQALAIMSGGALGPTVGGAQPIGRLSDPAFGGFESALTGPQGAQFGTGQGRSTPSAQDIAPDLASLLSSIFGQTGRTDSPDATGATGPPGISASEAAAQGGVGGVAAGIDAGAAAAASAAASADADASAGEI